VFQQINDPKSVIAFAERLVGAASRREEKQSQYLAVASFRFAAFAMTIGHFFTWSTLNNLDLDSYIPNAFVLIHISADRYIASTLWLKY
jgi:hypothetical protein